MQDGSFDFLELYDFCSILAMMGEVVVVPGNSLNLWDSKVILNH